MGVRRRFQSLYTFATATSLLGLATGKHKSDVDRITLESDETIHRAVPRCIRGWRDATKNILECSSGCYDYEQLSMEHMT